MIAQQVEINIAIKCNLMDLFKVGSKVGLDI